MDTDRKVILFRESLVILVGAEFDILAGSRMLNCFNRLRKPPKSSRSRRLAFS